MNPLRVALVVKDAAQSFRRNDKLSGLFSYPVPEFAWEHFVLGTDFRKNTVRWADRFDLVFHIDGSNWGTYHGPLPVVYYAIDSTLSDEHYQARYAQAHAADLVLVDQDRLERFTGTGRPVERLCYCVNDRLFRPVAAKRVDVGWHLGMKGPGGEGRRLMLDHLTAACAAGCYSLRARHLSDHRLYAQALAEARVVVNWPRTPTNRPYRVFDAMACRSCVVTGRLPEIAEDGRLDGLNILDGDTPEEVCALVAEALEGGRWAEIAAAGHELVMKRHTWAARARDLRALIARYFQGVGR